MSEVDLVDEFEREIARWQLEHVTVNGIGPRLRDELAGRLAAIADRRETGLQIEIERLKRVHSDA